MSELPLVPPPRCVNLHSKSMAVFGEAFEDDPDYQADLADFWCVLTARPLGPDGGVVNMPACRNPDRDCYQEY